MKRNESSSPSLVVMKHYGAPLTLDEWLALNNVNIDDPYDAELFDTLPECFHEEYTNRFANFVPDKGGIQ